MPGKKDFILQTGRMPRKKFSIWGVSWVTLDLGQDSHLLVSFVGREQRVWEKACAVKGSGSRRNLTWDLLIDRAAGPVPTWFLAPS